jgi:xylulokinase
MPNLLGIDIGTTATKALLLDPAAGVLAEASLPVDLRSPQPGWAEEDPAQWWRNVCELSRQLASGHDVQAVGISGAVPCVILVDEQGHVLRPSIQQNDARAVEQIERLRQQLADAHILERTGSPITQQSVGPKLCWLAENEPANWMRTTTVFGSYSLIGYWLTGQRTAEANWALESGLYDLATHAWAPDLFAAMDLDIAIVPPLRRPHDIIGQVTARAAEATRLPEGIPVVAGTADHVSSAFAAGVREPGDLVVKLGGSGDILMVTADLFVDERLYLDYHLIPGKYLPNGCMATSGSLIRWFQRELGAGAPLEQLDAEAGATDPGADGLVLLPYFLGEKTPINDPLARGAFVGLHLGHQRSHLFRAILEGIAFGFRHHLDVFAERGMVPRRARLTNGGARSGLWGQITADVLGLPLETVHVAGGSALGAAFVAGMGSGLLRSWQDIDRFVTVDQVIEPHAHPVYEERYRTYRSLYPVLKGILEKV